MKSRYPKLVVIMSFLQDASDKARFANVISKLETSRTDRKGERFIILTPSDELAHATALSLAEPFSGTVMQSEELDSRDIESVLKQIDNVMEEFDTIIVITFPDLAPELSAACDREYFMTEECLDPLQEGQAILFLGDSATII